MKQLLFLQFLLYFIFSIFSFGGSTDVDMSEGGNVYGGSIGVISIFKGFFYIWPIIMARLFMSKSYMSKALIFTIKHRCLFLYVLVILIELLWAANQTYSLTKISIFLISLGALASIIIQYEEIYKERAMFFLYKDLLSISFILCLIFIILFMIFGTFDLKMRNMFGPWCHANTVAVVTGVLIFFALHYRVHLKSQRLLLPKADFTLRTTIVLLSIVFCIAFSRGAILAFLMGIIGTSWLSYIWGQSSRAVLVSIITVMLMLGVFFMSDKIMKMVSRTDNGDDLTSMTGRDIIWKQVLHNLDSDALIHGHGYAALTPEVTIRLESKDISGAHNTYLQILAGSGVPGLVCFLWYFLAFYRRSKNKVFRAMEFVRVDFLAGVVIFLLVFSMNDMIFGLNLSPAFIVFIIINHASHQRYIFWR